MSLSTREAVERILNQSAPRLPEGFSSKMYSVYRYMLKEDKLSNQVMRNIITRFGGKLVVEEQWEINIPEDGENN